MLQGLPAEKRQLRQARTKTENAGRNMAGAALLYPIPHRAQGSVPTQRCCILRFANSDTDGGVFTLDDLMIPMPCTTVSPPLRIFT
jgi:hypothetical protein